MSVRRVVEIHPRDRTTIDGIPTTGIALTLLHVAALVSRERLATTLDSAIVQGLTRADRVLRCIDGYERRGRRGVGTLVELLGDRMDGRRAHESRFERRLVTLLHTAGLPRPTPQFEVRDGGTVIARPDLAYPELRIAIEADSYRWHGGRSAWERDLARRTELAAAGWLVLHCSWRDLVSRPTAVVSRVRRTLDLRTSAPADPASGSCGAEVVGRGRLGQPATAVMKPRRRPARSAPVA